MTNKDNNDNSIEQFLELVEGAKELYDDNRELFNNVLPNKGNVVNLDGPEPMAEAHINEDEVVIVAEVGDSGDLQLKASFDDGKMDFSVADERFSVNVPDDVVEDSLEATVNNGVLRATMKRQVEEDITVSVEKDSDDDDVIGINGGDEDGSA